MSKSPKVKLVNYKTRRSVTVSAKTASKVPAEINRRRAAEDRKGK